jgi:hypothetical protein
MIPKSPGDSFGVPLRNTYPDNIDRWKFHRERRAALDRIAVLVERPGDLTGLRVSDRSHSLNENKLPRSVYRCCVWNHAD